MKYLLSALVFLGVFLGGSPCAWGSSSGGPLAPEGLATRAEFVFEATVLKKAFMAPDRDPPRTIMILQVNPAFQVKGDIQSGLVRLLIPGGYDGDTIVQRSSGPLHMMYAVGDTVLCHGLKFDDGSIVLADHGNALMLRKENGDGDYVAVNTRGQPVATYSIGDAPPSEAIGMPASYDASFVHVPPTDGAMAWSAFKTQVQSIIEADGPGSNAVIPGADACEMTASCGPCVGDPASGDTDDDGICDDSDACPTDTSNDADGDGFCIGEGDCDDANDAVHPGATELCDDIDQDCDGDPLGPNCGVETCEAHECKKGKVNVCHKPGEPPENTLCISENAVPAHLGHGDACGECP